MIAYRPWTTVYDLVVPCPEAAFINADHVRVPWAAAPNAEAVVRTAEVTARFTVRKLRDAVNANNADVAHEDPVALQPPLTRLACDACQEEWDVWVGDDGKPEDPMDVMCGTAGCTRMGRPGRVVS